MFPVPLNSNSPLTLLLAWSLGTKGQTSQQLWDMLSVSPYKVQAPHRMGVVGGSGGPPTLGASDEGSMYTGIGESFEMHRYG